MENKTSVDKFEFKTLTTYFRRVRGWNQKELVRYIKEDLNIPITDGSFSGFKNHGNTLSILKATQIFNLLYLELKQEGQNEKIDQLLTDRALAKNELSLNFSDLLAFHEVLGYDYLKPLFEEEPKEILILTTWFNDFYAEFIQRLKLKQITQTPIKILLLHPNSSTVVERSRGLGQGDEYGRERILDNLNEIAAHLKGHENIQVKLYDGIPAFNGYIFSKLILCSWYFLQIFADKDNYLSIPYNAKTNTKTTANKFINHFNVLWERPNTETFDPLTIEENRNIWNAQKSFDQLSKFGSKDKWLDSFLGHWSMFYPFKDPKFEISPNHKFQNDIGQNIVHIYKNKHEVYCCDMGYYDSNQPLYRGMINFGLSSSEYLTFTLFSPGNDKVLNIILRRSSFSSNTHLGSYNVIYKSDTSGSGSGLTVFKKIVNKPIPDPVIIQLESRINLDRIPNDFVLNYLSKGAYSLFPSIPFDQKSTIKDNFQNCIYAGFYKIYAYGRIDDVVTCISISTLEIKKTGYVVYNKKRNTEYKTFGNVSMPDDALRIHLEDEETRRTGIMTVYVAKKRPISGRLYTGTFSGVSFDKNIPLASRFVMQFIDKELPTEFIAKKISLKEVTDQEVPKEIKKLLSGRSDNLITYRNGRDNFTLAKLKKENKSSIDFVQLYLDSAKYNFISAKGDTEKGIKMLRRSIKHGLSEAQFKTFMDECKTYKQYGELIKIDTFLEVVAPFENNET